MTYEYQEEQCYDDADKNIYIRHKTANFEFVCTCIACPEQYDVFLGGKQVGYVRLRWADLSCSYPDVGGAYIYSFSWGGEDSNGGYKGEFDNDDERKYHLELIAQALYNKIFNAEHTAES